MRLAAAVGILLITASGGRLLGQDSAAPDFNRDVRPILANHCFACHGPDEATREADLRLDTREGATADLGGYRALVPGNLEHSELFQRVISEDPDMRMPPADAEKDLTEAQVDVLRRWIESGAEFPGHWSFEPIADPVVPAEVAVSDNPIDRFVAARLRELGRSLSGEADRSTLIRRVSLTLTGLPPSLSEIDAYLNDSEPGAYERMVEKYLASPAYGEEMARHWLDLARYADTHGLHLDNERQTWAYRDWVIERFNENQPFDQFTIEQLAGDLLPSPSPSQLVATGFNRCNVTTSEGGAIDAEYTFRYAVDRTVVMAETWMGLTVGCAVCHDHKFDPITQKDFYSLYAFFNSAADPAMDGNALLTQPVLRLATPEDEARLADFDKRLSDLQNSLASRVAATDYADPAEQQPAPLPESVETIWMDDAFPAAGSVVASPGEATQFVSTESGAPVLHGTRSLKRVSQGLAQDVWQGPDTDMEIPPDGTIFAHVWLESTDPPQAIMVQFFKGGWLHRAVWGDYKVIDWGAKGTTERVDMGRLPEAGKWVRLEFPAAAVGLKGGDRIAGFALTQFGGTVYWDRVGVAGIVDPANDPARSLRAWWREMAKAKAGNLPEELKGIAQDGPDSEVDSAARQRLRDYYLQHVCATTRPLFSADREAIERLQEERRVADGAIPRTFIYREMANPRDSFVMARGQYNQPGEKVEPAVPDWLPTLVPREGRTRLDRLDLARWLVSEAHPLTARVAVNRFWQQVFGVGLVKSSGDFGTQGDVPINAELLDWLASEFRESAWDVKGLMRLLVSSQAFRQSSRLTPELWEFDPENRYLARGPRMRLDAEQIRDSALFVSGLIRLQRGGKGVKPYQPDNIWEPVGYVDSNTRFYKRDSGDALYRRSIYTFFKRTAPPPFMANFDAPNREQSCPRRERSNTPLQALQLMNDVQHVEAARFLAQRMILEGGEGAGDRLRFGIRVVLSRQPRPEELEVLQRQLQFHLQRFSGDLAAAEALIAFGDAPRNSDLAAAELAAYTMVASTLLNRDETLNRN